eukprot:gene6816-55126_t
MTNERPERRAVTVAAANIRGLHRRIVEVVLTKVS